MRGSYVPPKYIPLETPDLEAEGEAVISEFSSDHHRRHQHQIMRDPALWSSGICACFDDMPSCTILSDLLIP